MERTIMSPTARITRTLTAVVVAFIVFGVTLFAVAGTVHWPAAWVYFGLLVLGQVMTTVLLLRYSPHLVDERLRKPSSLGDVPVWDLWLSRLMGALLPLSIYVVAALDFRFGRVLAVGDVWRWLAVSVGALGQVLLAWAMVENRFFAAVVRVQTERSHAIVSTGPYRLIRHPGYAAALMYFVVAPIALHSPCAIIPVALYVLVVGVRTAKEDGFLRERLPGYPAYAQRKRWRLIPGIF
jgi:protein-S-isoprenylcysteine O-methyltransferase Ste14